MEDVVLHYQPGSADGLRALLETTQRLLEPFPCLPPPVFRPWFPDADHHLAIRPAKPAPLITKASVQILVSHKTDALTEPLPEIRKPKRKADDHLAERPHGRPHTKAIRVPGESVCISENVLPTSLFNKPDREITILPPEKHREVLPVTDSPVKRSWSVFAQKSILLPSSQSLSRQFQHTVSIHTLHLRQRAKWVISQHNCRPERDIEEVWRALNQSVQSSRLPTCNANIQRERAEIWVFCDILFSEQVGRFLKDELQLSGRISLSVHRLLNIFSM